MAGLWVACETDGHDGLEAGTCYGVVGGALGGVLGVVAPFATFSTRSTTARRLNGRCRCRPCSTWQPSTPKEV